MFALLVVNCSSGKREETKVVVSTENDVPFDVAEGKEKLESYYQLDYIKEWYPERILPPAFDYNTDLSKKSIVELWLLRNEIFARNGYLFSDAALRGHFNQFKWYQPIWDVADFKVQLNRREQEFVDRVLAREAELANDRYTKENGAEMIRFDHVYNQFQFKEISEPLQQALAKNNFAIVPAKHEQFFHVYDNNSYEYIPNFITTDIYIHTLHKHFSALLQKIEEEKFIPLMNTLLTNCYQQSRALEQSTNDEAMKDAASWSTTYLAVAASLLSDEGRVVADDMKAMYEDELDKTRNAKGTHSEFLKSDFVAYNQFEPRGNYTRSKELSRYFRCIKWLNTAAIKSNSDAALLSALLMASYIKSSPENLSAFNRFNEAIKFIVGDEDNASMGLLIEAITADEAKNPSLLSDPKKLAAIRKQLTKAQQNKIKPKGGNAPVDAKLNDPSILFTAGRYTFDAEILSRLIHVLSPSPKRPFPKGLDVFAALGNNAAKEILMGDFHEQKSWPSYPDSLDVVKDKFSTFGDWDKNIYSKTMGMIQSLGRTTEESPLFMKTGAWKKKDLITSLSAWTELKHDMLLYAEQPYAAEAGEGGGPPPPQHISYVEPDVEFWQKALDLLDYQEKKLMALNIYTEHAKSISDDLKKIGTTCLAVSKKELARAPLTKEEFEELSWLGGTIEYLTFRIFDSDHLPEKERLVAIVADVYNYNGEFLEEAVGAVDEIYVVAEINGKPYLTKGAVFSYYEFTNSGPMTDESWKDKVSKEQEPSRPVWTNDITVRTNSLESKPSYSLNN